uniref:Uncharacterized protein n=1 Tax=Aegilops tauschii subsp. strangulata TaxID=200361 RepID=A0A452ZDZ4_AEGTS
MDKHAIRILALALLLHLTCYATIAQCRIIADMDSEKINLPNGLCGLQKLCSGDICYCCLANNTCYGSMVVCKSFCG